MPTSSIDPPRTTSPRIRIVVSTEDVERSKRSDSSHCMIAEAIRTQVPGSSYVSVDLATIRWSDRKKGVRYIYLTPPAAQVALLRFDQGDENLAGFAFRLANAAQIVHILTSKASKARAEQQPPKDKTKPTAAKRPTAPGPAVLRQEKGTKVPVKKGGDAPPMGVLADDPRRGRIRKFGLGLAGRPEAPEGFPPAGFEQT